MSAILLKLQSGEWLTRERIRLWSFAVLVSSLVAIGYVIATSDGLNDYQGRPLGTDFSNIYAGGTYVLDGHPGDAFDPPRQHAREQKIFGAATPFYGWCYPPFLLFIAAALALLPYMLALLVWQGVTLALYLFSIRWILSSFVPSPRWGEGQGEGDRAYRSFPPHPTAQSAVDLSPTGRGERGNIARDPLWILLALAFPAAFVNIGHGHNGFLTAALFGGALVVLDKRPLLAGILFGLLSYKPQFGAMIPLVLIATGRWRAFGAAGATVLALALASTLAFGSDIWRAFFDSLPFTREVVLEAGGTGWHKIQSVFSWVRMWGGSVPLAYAVQGAVTVAAAGALVWLWRSGTSYPLKAAALLIASILATPYSLDYDMMVLAPAIAFVAADGFARGFDAWEKSTLALVWVVPLVARTVAEHTKLPIGVWAMLLLFVLILHRAANDLGLFRRRIAA